MKKRRTLCGRLVNKKMNLSNLLVMYYLPVLDMVVFEEPEKTAEGEVKQVKKLYSNKYLEDLLMLDMTGLPALSAPNMVREFQNAGSSKYTKFGSGFNFWSA